MYSSTYKTGAVGNFAGDNTTVPAMQQQGHLVGMLKKDGYGYVDTYITRSMQNFNTSSATAIDYDSRNLVIDGSLSTPKYMKSWEVSGDSWSGTKAVAFTIIGSNAYMEWGEWTQTNAMTTSNGTYYFNNNGAYVWGTPTTDAEMNDLRKIPTGAGTYSGNAWGTYFTTGGGTSMTGTFSGTVNFTSNQVTNFNVNVSDGNSKSVSISSATGNFSTTAGQKSTFLIDSATGTWKINNTTLGTGDTNKGASGTVYGNTGQYIGGVWTVGKGSDLATGGFQGKK
jgi:hypothetical protein